MPAVKKLKRVSYILPSFAVRASSNTKCDPIFFGGAANFFLPHGPPDGVHILDLVLEPTNLQRFFSHCRMREQLCHIDHPDSITKMPSARSLVSVLPRVIRLTLCYVSSRSWRMPCASTAPSKRFTSATARLVTWELRSGGWSDVECLLEVV